MFSVLVVDDDNNVRNGLKVLVPWEEYGFEIVDCAMDGKDAIDKYKQRSFDLIVVDIQMPRMDGLELIAAVRGMDPFVRFLVLTGHAEFEYAKKAIEWKVDGYILKPIDEDELIENLKKIRASIQKHQEDKLFAAGGNNSRCESLIQSILSGNFTDQEGDLIERASQIGLSWPSYQVLLVQPEQEGGQTAQLNVRRRLKQIFNNNAKGIVFKGEGFQGILLNASITSEDSLGHLYGELNRIMAESGTAFFSSIGEPVKKLLDISRSYETAEKLLKNRFIAGNKQILSMSLLSGRESGIGNVPSGAGLDMQMASDKLYYAIEIGNSENVSQLTGEWITRMFTDGYSEKAIKTALIRITTVALNKLAHTGCISLAEVQECLAGLTEIYNQPDLVTLKDFVIKELNTITCFLNDGNNVALMKKIIDLAERNYCDKLTLEILSEAFNYSSGYLGRLFKKHTGESFNTYIDKVRIRKAKELLLQGMKVYQVASLIGYSNVDYFHSKFRKYAGISPSNFRKDKKAE